MSEWKKVKLKDVATNITDGKHGDCKDQDGSGYYFVSCKDVYDGEIHYENARQITKEDFEDTDKRTKLAPDDILITNSGTIGRMAFVKDQLSTRKTTFQKSVAIVKPDSSKVFPLYLYYLLRSKVGEIINSSNGAAQKNLLLSTMRDFDLEIYDSSPLQIRIATILSRYDSLIENYQQQVKLLEEAAQRLYKEWFVELRFPGYESTKVVDGVPEGWKEEKVTESEHFYFAKCRITPFDGTKTYYATADVDNTYICSVGTPINYDNKPSRAQIQPSQNSIWFARMSNSYKIIGFTNTNDQRREDAILSSGFAGFESPYCNYGFLYCLISSKWFDEQKNRFATGATQVSLTNEGLSRIKFLSPDTKLVKDFSLKTNRIIENIFLLREICFKLTEARDRLLPKLMGGEITI